MNKLIVIIIILFNITVLHSQRCLIYTPLDYIPVANKLAYPVNHGNMGGYYDAQPFGTNNHLGADISSLAYGNSDEGDTIYSIGNGQVVCVFKGSYGTEESPCYAYIVEILHKTKNGVLVSQYRHCKEVFVTSNQPVTYLQPIATIGTECRHFLAHLHFEIRTTYNILIGPGYGNPTGYTDPMKYIKNFNK
jgi:murein DD-endopeptidase MepM/ murein hydrolase activator NlpD